TYAGAWWWHLAGSLGIGAVLGLLFYLLAVFGVIASIPKIPMPLGQLPTSNELVALVLGFFGGYWARAWIPNPGGAPPPAPRRQTTVSTGACIAHGRRQETDRHLSGNQSGCAREPRSVDGRGARRGIESGTRRSAAAGALSRRPERRAGRAAGGGAEPRSDV